jgi:hypothetical protein
MELKKHKWADEIHAWADGKTIQKRLVILNNGEIKHGEWRDVTNDSGSVLFFNSDFAEYRIKP